MVCPRADISTVGWHTLAFRKAHIPSRGALSSLHVLIFHVTFSRQLYQARERLAGERNCKANGTGRFICHTENFKRQHLLTPTS